MTPLDGAAIRARLLADPAASYRVLGAGEGATDVEIRRAFRRVAARAHPDGAAPDPELFALAVGARDLLLDPALRAACDAAIRAGRERSARRAAPFPKRTRGAPDARRVRETLRRGRAEGVVGGDVAAEDGTPAGMTLEDAAELARATADLLEVFVRIGRRGRR